MKSRISFSASRTVRLIVIEGRPPLAAGPSPAADHELATMSVTIVVMRSEWLSPSNCG